MIRALLTAGLLAAWSLSIGGCAGRAEPAAAPAPVVSAPSSRGPCGPRNVVVRQLQEGYGERLAALGIAQGGGAVVELYVAEDGDTWTLLHTLPIGVSCLMATGQGWEMARAALGPGL